MYLPCCTYLLCLQRKPGHALFRHDACAAGIDLSPDCTTATKQSAVAKSLDTNVLLTRPLPGADGSLTVTWIHQAGTDVKYGWTRPDLNPSSIIDLNKDGSFVGSDGQLSGVGNLRDPLPDGLIPVNATVSLRYDPVRGSIYARINGGVLHPCFTGLAGNLVPVVCLIDPADSCSIQVLL